MVHALRFDAELQTLSVSSSFLETPKLEMERRFAQSIYGPSTEELFMALNTDERIATPSKFGRAVKLLKFFVGRFVDAHRWSPFDRNSYASKFKHSCANTDILRWPSNTQRLYAGGKGEVRDHR